MGIDKQSWLKTQKLQDILGRTSYSKRVLILQVQHRKLCASLLGCLLAILTIHFFAGIFTHQNSCLGKSQGEKRGDWVGISPDLSFSQKSEQL